MMNSFNNMGWLLVTEFDLSGSYKLSSVRNNSQVYHLLCDTGCLSLCLNAPLTVSSAWLPTHTTLQMPFVLIERYLAAKVSHCQFNNNFLLFKFSFIAMHSSLPAYCLSLLL